MKYVQKKINRNGAGCLSSLIEIEFVEKLEKQIGFCLDHTYKTNQFFIKKDNKRYVYDIVHKNKCLEFHGDFWHCNPLIYKEDYYHKLIGAFANEIWEKDEHKLNIIRELGYDTMVVWENEYRKNKDSLIEEIAKWLLNE